MLLQRFRQTTSLKTFLQSGRRSFAAASHGHDSKHHEEPFNEPGGYLFGRIPGRKYPVDWTERLYIVFYLGGMVVFGFLYQYKPDTNPQEWAKKEALKRIAERGINLEDYRYKLPEVY